MTPLGNYIVKARKQRGWTRAELARHANMPYTTLRNIEASKTDVHTSEENLKALADALGETAFEQETKFAQMRVLAGYLVVGSKDTSDADRRLLANLAAHPNLRKSLEKLLARGNAAEIDRALTVLEVTDALRGRQ